MLVKDCWEGTGESAPLRAMHLQGIDRWEGFGESAPLRAMQGKDCWEGTGESAPIRAMAGRLVGRIW
jgi:hypothetical protein